MKKTALLFIAMALLSISAEAKIWRVNSQSNYNGSTLFGENFGGTPAYPVFKQINQAIQYNVVTAGDTLHIEGSALLYETATLTKKLVLIGPGYFLDQNPQTSNNMYDARVRRIVVESTAADSQIIGLNLVVAGSSLDGTIQIEANGVTVKRCRFERGIEFATLLTDVYILQNFFAFINNGNNCFSTNGFSSFVPPNNIVFNNNICQSKLIWKSSTATWNINECNNNVFDGPANTLNLDFNCGSFKNNILKAAGITATINGGSNINVEHNTVSNVGVFAGTPGNLVVANMSSLFVTSGTTDGVYQLQPDSVSNVPGSDGVERGAFGGAAAINRYTLSGLAAIPVLYELSTVGVATGGSGLPVTINARTVK